MPKKLSEKEMKLSIDKETKLSKKLFKKVKKKYDLDDEITDFDVYQTHRCVREDCTDGVCPMPLMFCDEHNTMYSLYLDTLLNERKCDVEQCYNKIPMDCMYGSCEDCRSTDQKIDKEGNTCEYLDCYELKYKNNPLCILHQLTLKKYELAKHRVEPCRTEGCFGIIPIYGKYSYCKQCVNNQLVPCANKHCSEMVLDYGKHDHCEKCRKKGLGEINTWFY